MSVGVVAKGPRQQGSASSGFVGGPRRDIRTDFQGHQVPRSRDGYGGGIGSKWEAVGEGVFGSDARTRPRDVVSATDRLVNRGFPALGGPIAPLAIRDRRRPSPK